MNKRSSKVNHRATIWVRLLSYRDMCILEKIVRKKLQPISMHVRVGGEKYMRGIPFPMSHNVYDTVKQAPRRTRYWRASIRTATPNVTVDIRPFRVNVYGDRRTNSGAKLRDVDITVGEIQKYLMSRKLI